MNRVTHPLIGDNEKGFVIALLVGQASCLSHHCPNTAPNLRNQGFCWDIAVYRIKWPTAQVLIIQHHPWLQRCVGLLFVIGGLCVAYLVFPNLVLLRCDRSQNMCFLEQSNLFRSQVSQIPLSDITAGRLETVPSERGYAGSGTTYRIWIDTQKGPIPFTSYSIGTLASDKAEIVPRINAYLKDRSASTLEVVEDERLLFYLLGAGLICFGLLPLCFVRTVTCRLDKMENRFFMKGGGLWGFKKVERPLSDLLEASLWSVGKGLNQTYRVVFKFASGAKIPLTYYRYLGVQRPRMVVKEVNEFLGFR